MSSETTLSIACAADLEGVNECVTQVEAALGLDPHSGAALRVVLMESLSNAILHGALKLPGASALADRMALAEQARTLSGAPVALRAGWTEGGSIVVEVEDAGDGFDWRRAAKRPGRGLSIVRALCERVEWNERGNLIRMVLKETAR